MDATHSAAFILGFLKLYNFGNKSVWVGVETLKQSETSSALLRVAGNRYVHGGDNGYTNLNQIMGAGVGYGSDLQSVRIKYQKDNSPWDFQFNCEKIQRDPLNSLAKWTDLIWEAEPTFKNHYFNIKLSMNFVLSSNYTWVDGKDSFNLLTKIQILYSLH